MLAGIMTRWPKRAGGLVLPLLVCFASVAHAERLPLKTYTVADGLAHNEINKIVRDSRGFLWFCTDDGLSRFDGYEFINFGIEQGLPHPVVNDLLETRGGEYWVATNGGLCKFNPNGLPSRQVVIADKLPADPSSGPMFIVVTPVTYDRYAKAVTTLLQVRDGTIWYGARSGVFRLTVTNTEVKSESVDIGLENDFPEERYINALLEDRYGILWIGGPAGLFRRWPDGRSARYGKENGLPDDNIHDLLEASNGNMWVATRFGGLFQLATSAGHEAPVVKRAYSAKNGLGTNWVFDLFESSEGKLWVGASTGLFEFSLNDRKASGPLHVYTKRNGLSYHEIANLAEDRDGNLWLGTVNGAMKLARGGFSTFDERDGIGGVNSIFASGTGGFYLSGWVVGDQRASVFEGAKLELLNPSIFLWRRVGFFDGQRFSWLIPNALRNKHLGWSDKLVLQSRLGEWWIGTGEGLFLFPPTSTFAALKSAHPLANYTIRDGLATLEVSCIYEDSRGDLWVSTVGSNGNGLARWERASRTLHDMAQTDGLPSLKEKLPTAFSEDRAGNVWVGFNQGELARYRNGRFAVFTTADGLPTSRVDDLYLDRSGRLWIAMRRGLVRVDDPTAEHPNFVTYTTAQGLSSNYVTAITEDLVGRIYIGTGQGLDRLETANGPIKHYTTADGLPLGEVVTAACDREGSIWIGGRDALSRLQSEPTRSSEAPAILIERLSIAGTSQHVSAIGETEVSLPDLSPSRNQLQIDFVGLSFAPGELLRYQYRLEGAAGDWTKPGTQRTVNFANLAPGRYRFLVRAVNSNGVASPQPATITFIILRPIWQRWWFLTLVLLVIGAAAHTAYRYRVARIVQMERVRTRIATDLHDDIGASLSLIAMLSELAQRQRRQGAAKIDESLSAIAEVSRESVAAMSDIVWAINPRKDRLSELVKRMRRFSSDVLGARDILLKFEAAIPSDVELDADARREILSIFKEGVNNIARHAAAGTASVNISTANHYLTIELEDDGRGFDVAGETDGNGLDNMRQRARKLGGQMDMVSEAGCGTSLTLRVPLTRMAKKEMRR